MAKVDNDNKIYIYGKRQDYIVRIPMKEILCFLVNRRRYTYVYYKNTFARMPHSLSYVYKKLNRRTFIKVSKKAIINTKYIDDIMYNKPSHSIITLNNGIITKYINVNRKYLANIKKRFKIKWRWK